MLHYTEDNFRQGTEQRRDVLAAGRGLGLYGMGVVK